MPSSLTTTTTMTTTTKGTSVTQEEFHVPDIPLKVLREVIPTHCFDRSLLKSFSYLVRDILTIGIIYALTTTWTETLISLLGLQSSGATATGVRIAIWNLYGFCVGLFATGLWVVAHECGHDAFSGYTWVNNSVGWILHSALGVPYYSWRITHRNHHRFTAHAEKDEVFVPFTRSDYGLKECDPSREDFWGAMVIQEVKKEMWDALGDSPVGAMINCASYLLAGWPSYLLFNASGQKRRPWYSNHLNPKAEMYISSQFWQIIISDIGVLIWFCAVLASIYHFGFQTVFRTYLVPYFWVNHWVVAISFLQHTDTCLPRYRDSQFTFLRGALSTLDRNLMGDLGPLGWLGSYATHGVSETHLLHHVCSRIPHYHAWEASQALKKKLAEYGYTRTEGGAVGWSELYRVYRECKFIEDNGDIVFFKNSYGLAKMRPVMNMEGK